jgi:hypothetical protein
MSSVLGSVKDLGVFLLSLPHPAHMEFFTIVIAVFLAVGYVIGVGVYRLWWHPLASVPGPKVS